MELMLMIILCLLLPAILTITAFFYYLVRRKKDFFLRMILFLLELFSLIIDPLIFILVVNGQRGDCCDPSFFAHHEMPTILAIIGLAVSSYYYSAYRRNIASPVLELLVNTSLTNGLFLNVLMILQDEFINMYIIVHIPVMILLCRGLWLNYSQYRNVAQEQIVRNTGLTAWAWRIVLLPPFKGIIVMMILGFPLLLLLSLVLLFFGQKPDSILRAFTETYDYGLSQLGPRCKCDGHYLCSVAAKGHQHIVRPLRYGVRGGTLILCNRQLLVANAFEEIIAEKMPRLHRFIRRNYDQVGKRVHRYDHFFSINWVADGVYILMKPAEWFFLFVLYCVDRNPEERIARQYLPR